MGLELGYRFTESHHLFTVGLELGYRFTESQVYSGLRARLQVHSGLRARLQVHRVTGSR